MILIITWNAAFMVGEYDESTHEIANTYNTRKIGTGNAFRV